MKKIAIILMFISGAAFANYKLTINLNSFGPHLGQELQIRVTDTGSGFEVGRTVIPSIEQTSFSVDMYVLMPGHSYRVDLYADYNENGQFDAPPDDHAWSFNVDNVEGDTTTTFAHNTHFDPIDFPPVVSFSQLVDSWEGMWVNPTYDVSGMATADVAVVNDTTFQLTLKAWGIFGNPDAVTYDLVGNLNAAGDTLHFTTGLPWNGDIRMSNGSIWGTVGYPDQGISADVRGNYGIGQVIVYYLMTGAFTAEEYSVVERDVPTQVAEQGLTSVPENFVLHGNFPNPFNPSTRIQFDLGASSDVHLQIFDILGKQIFAQNIPNMTAGQHEFTWSGVDQAGQPVPSGIYFYRLSGRSNEGSFSQVRKMTLLK